MKSLTRALSIIAFWALSGPTFAAGDAVQANSASATQGASGSHWDRHRGAVPIYATFGVQWTPINWDDPYCRRTESLGAAEFPHGRVISLITQDCLNTVDGWITSTLGYLAFSPEDWVEVRYEKIPASYDPITNTAGFKGPLQVVDGGGRFKGATGNLTISTRVLFDPLPVATFTIRGVIKTKPN